MDPSHIHRAGEVPAEALSKVLSRVRHIHIRDCKGPGPGPGEPKDQACGRGDIDLPAYFKAMVDGGYDGPVCLEVIGAEGLRAVLPGHRRRRELRLHERLPEGARRALRGLA